MPTPPRRLPPSRLIAPRRACRFGPTLLPRSRLRPVDCGASPAFAVPTAPIPTAPGGNTLRDALTRIEHRTLLPIALACLILGLVFGATGAFLDSAVASHASKAAMIFGFAGLRRATGFGPEAVDASA